MLFVSTRGKTDLVCSAHAITRGLADDGAGVLPVGAALHGGLAQLVFGPVAELLLGVPPGTCERHAYWR